MIAVIDYGVGNLFSLSCSLKKIGADSIITNDKDVIKKASALILPGVGAFGDATTKLRENALDRTIKETALSGKPLLGICLGMQLLFDKSYEYGEHSGLGLIGGYVDALSNYVPHLKIPHMGWNSLNIKARDCPIIKYTSDKEYVYFVHSYCGICKDSGNLVATTDYGIDVTAIVWNGNNIFGTQFHPEKSSDAGLKILKAFVELGE